MANCGLLLNDGTSFLLLNDSTFLLLNDNSCSAEPESSVVPYVPSPPGLGEGAGGFAETWRRHWQDQAKRDLRKARRLALIRASDDYRRLKRKLIMLQEHLLDAEGNNDGMRKFSVKERIEKIERQIKMMERVD